MNFRQCIKVVAASAILMSSLAANATIITITPDAIINVSLDGDNNSPGSVDSGSLSSSDVIARERAVTNEDGMRISSFFDFDLSLLSSSLVNSSAFSAVFAADFDVRLNDVNDMSVLLGQVAGANVWDNTLSAGTVPLFDWAATSLNQNVLVSSVLGATVGTYTVDLTGVVRDWVNGISVNNGLVLFGSAPVFQGAGFSNLELIVDVPAPSVLGIFVVALGFLRLRKAY